MHQNSGSSNDPLNSGNVYTNVTIPLTSAEHDFKTNVKPQILSQVLVKGFRDEPQKSSNIYSTNTNPLSSTEHKFEPCKINGFEQESVACSNHSSFVCDRTFDVDRLLLVSDRPCLRPSVICL